MAVKFPLNRQRGSIISSESSGVELSLFSKLTSTHQIILNNFDSNTPVTLGADWHLGRIYITAYPSFNRTSCFFGFLFCLWSGIFFSHIISTKRVKRQKGALGTRRQWPPWKTKRITHNHLHWKRAGEYRRIRYHDLYFHNSIWELWYRHRDRSGNLSFACLWRNHSKNSFAAISSNLCRFSRIPSQIIRLGSPTSTISSHIDRWKIYLIYRI